MATTVSPQHILRESVVRHLVIVWELVRGESLKRHRIEQKERTTFYNEGKGELSAHHEYANLHQTWSTDLGTVSLVEDLQDFMVRLAHCEHVARGKYVVDVLLRVRNFGWKLNNLDYFLHSLWWQLECSDCLILCACNESFRDVPNCYEAFLRPEDDAIRLSEEPEE